MKEIEKEICIEGIDCIVTLQIFEKEDVKDLIQLWDNLDKNNKILKKNSARRHNLHEFISEGIACYHLNLGRKKKMKLKGKSDAEKKSVREKQKKYIKKKYGKDFKKDLSPEQKKDVDKKFHPKLPSISFDCIDFETGQTVQVKGSIGLTDEKTGEIKHEDLTNFGPKSKFQKLIFLDFYNSGVIDGKFKAYDIPLEILFSTKITANTTLKERLESSASSNETKSRPHFSLIKKVIEPNEDKIIFLGDYDLKKS